MLRALLEAPAGPPAVHELFLGPFPAVVVVADGQVQAVRAGPFVGEDALLRLLLLSRRPVSTQHDAPSETAETPLGSTSELLVRFDLFAGDLQRQSTRAGGLSRVWAVRFLALKAVLQGLPDDVKRVVRLMDGTRDVQNLIAESPLPPPLTLRVVERLLQRGTLERADLGDDDDDDGAVPAEPSAQTRAAPTEAVSADHSWLQERTSRPPEPSRPVEAATLSTPLTAKRTSTPTAPMRAVTTAATVQPATTVAATTAAPPLSATPRVATPRLSAVAATTAPTAELSDAVASEPVLLEKRRGLPGRSLPDAIPVPRAQGGAELSAWLGPEDKFFEPSTPIEAEPLTWAPWTLVIIVVAGAAIGAIVAMAFS